MKFLVVLAIFGVGTVLAEAPVAPYAPRGWKPDGPAFELPTETVQPSQDDVPLSKSEIDITQEDIQYNGEIPTTDASTPFQEYGPPATATTQFDDETTLPGQDDPLSVQGLPEPDQPAEFRVPARFTSRRNQKLRQQTPRRAQFRQQQQFFSQNQFQRQQQFRQNYQQPQLSARLQAPTQQRFNQRFVPQQFGRFTQARTRPVFSQRLTSQRQTLDSYGAPAQAYGPPSNPTQEYGPPNQEYQPPTQPPQEYGTPIGEEPQLEDLPQEEPEQIPQAPENEEPIEPNDDENETGPNVAIATAVATPEAAKYRTRSGRLTAARNAQFARFQQINQPIYMYNQFGQLVRIL